jgi:hypothetical protein
LSVVRPRGGGVLEKLAKMSGRAASMVLSMGKEPVAASV